MREPTGRGDGWMGASPGQDGGTVLHCAAWQGAAGCVEAALRHDGVGGR